MATNNDVALVASGVLILLAVVMPWYRTSALGITVSVQGYNLVAGIVVAAAVLGGLASFVLSEGYETEYLFVSGAFVVIVALTQIISPLSAETYMNLSLKQKQLVAPNIGLYFTLIGGLAFTVASIRPFDKYVETSPTPSQS